MAFYTGRKGSLTILDGTNDEKTVAKIRDWSIETTLELLSTNDISSAANTFVPGVSGATGSATLIYYKVPTADNATFTEFTVLLNKIMKKRFPNESPRPVEATDRVRLLLNAGGTKDDIRCDVYITSASISVSTGELSVVPINFTVDGGFVETIQTGEN